MKDIALIGRARSGKDTVGARLVSRYGYTRLAFADPLKEMALGVNPWIIYDCPGFFSGEKTRLADLVEHVGWERAKEEYPEVRRTLQTMGESVRRIDPDFWINALLEILRETPGPAVVTDVRYPNEARALTRKGFRLVRIVRPGIEPPAPYGNHISETALDDYATPVTVVNSGTLEDLHAHADSIAF